MAGCAVRVCRRYSSRCRAVGCRAISSAPIHGAAKGSSARDARKRERRKWPADDVDEYGCSTIGAGQISFKNIDVESKPVTLKFRGLQHDHGVANCRTILAERRYRCVRGSFAKLSVPIAQSSMMWLVVSCPAARTGRSAKTIEFGATPVSTSLFPCKLTPCELRTIREGTTSGLVTPPIVFCSGTCGGAGGAVWASAIPDVQSTLTTVTTIKGTRVT